MENSKANFISDLLKTRSLSINNKERIIELCAREFEKSILTEENIRSLIEESKRGLLTQEDVKKLIDNQNSQKGKNVPQKDKREFKHCPKDTAVFLSLFNAREGFKYLTHDYDNPDNKFDYPLFLEKTKKIFTENTKKYVMPSNLWALIGFFIYGTNLTKKGTYKNWTSYKGEEIRENWSSPEWINWSKENSLHPIRNEHFEQIINEFRSTTRIVAPALQGMLAEIIDNVDKEKKFKFECKDLNKADFYTNVRSLKYGIERIIGCTMFKYKDYPKISISYKRETQEDFLIRKIYISQIGSFPTKPLDDVMNKFNIGGGDFAEIKEIFKGYCNWSIETIWDEKPIRWNILDDNGFDEIETIDKENVQGFTHILTFYQK